MPRWNTVHDMWDAAGDLAQFKTSRCAWKENVGTGVFSSDETCTDQSGTQLDSAKQNE